MGRGAAIAASRDRCWESGGRHRAPDLVRAPRTGSTVFPPGRVLGGGEWGARSPARLPPAPAPRLCVRPHPRALCRTGKRGEGTVRAGCVSPVGLRGDPDLLSVYCRTRQAACASATPKSTFGFPYQPPGFRLHALRPARGLGGALEVRVSEQRSSVQPSPLPAAPGLRQGDRNSQGSDKELIHPLPSPGGGGRRGLTSVPAQFSPQPRPHTCPGHPPAHGRPVGLWDKAPTPPSPLLLAGRLQPWAPRP